MLLLLMLLELISACKVFPTIVTIKSHSTVNLEVLLVAIFLRETFLALLTVKLVLPGMLRFMAVHIGSISKNSSTNWTWNSRTVYISTLILTPFWCISLILENIYVLKKL